MLIFHSISYWIVMKYDAVLRLATYCQIRCQQKFMITLGGRKGIRPVKNWEVRYWHSYLSGARCKWFAYGTADATAIPSSLAPVKSIVVYLFVPVYSGCSGKKGTDVIVVVVVVMAPQNCGTRAPKYLNSAGTWVMLGLDLCRAGCHCSWCRVDEQFSRYHITQSESNELQQHWRGWESTDYDCLWQQCRPNKT